MTRTPLPASRPPVVYTGGSRWRRRFVPVITARPTTNSDARKPQDRIIANTDGNALARSDDSYRTKLIDGGVCAPTRQGADNGFRRRAGAMQTVPDERRACSGTT
jgi:hypothetical protein